MMEFSIDTLINIASLLLGGGGGAFFVWRWTKRKAKAEAQEAEVDMAQKVQDTYQQMLRDKDTEVADKNRIINELREDRDHFRKDRNELRERLDKTDEKIRDLREEVARNGRQIKAMRPFMCYVSGCKRRQLVEVLEHAESEKKTDAVEPSKH